MSIQSSVIDIYVEPQVASIELVASPVINEGLTLSIVTFSGTAYDSSKSIVPNATVTFSVDTFDTTVPSTDDIISASKTAGTQQVALTDSNGHFSFNASGTFDNYVAAVVSGEGVNSNVVYAYAHCTISISSSTTTPEVGAGFTVTVDVKDSNGNYFDNTTSGTVPDAMTVFDGPVAVVLYHEDISTGAITSTLTTSSSGSVAFTVTLNSIGGHKLQAVAFSTVTEARNASPPIDL